MLDWQASESDLTAMRRLMLLRHAKTEQAGSGERDHDRKLTKRGRDDAPVIGAYMARHNLVPDLVLVSPATRAVETWTLVAAALAKKSRVVTEAAVYNTTADKLIALIGETGKAQTLLVVGHNPSLHDLAKVLIASGDAKARERVNEKLPTAGLVLIDLAIDDWSLLHPHCGRLERFVSPRSIAAATE
jgi:phosphohistidine phosphatase